MKKLLLILTILIFSQVGLSAEDFIVRVPQDEGYPPFFVKEKSKKWTGLSIELAEILLKELGIKPVYLKMPFARGLWYLKTGEIQMMLNLSINKEREKYIKFIGPQLDETVLFVVSKDFKKEIKSFVDITNLPLHVGIERKKYYGEKMEEIKKHRKYKRCFESVTDICSNEKKLLAGRISGFLGYGYNVFYKFRTDPNYKNFKICPLKIHNSFVYYGLSKKSVPHFLFNGLKEAYEKLEKNGEFEKIRSKYREYK